MEVIEGIKKDKAYIKYKLVVKSWEKDFKIKYSRTPSKFDIKEAPSNIKYAYKKYFQLKSTALENSLSVYEIDERPFGSPEAAHHLGSILCGSLSPQLQACSEAEQLLPSLPSGQELEELLSQVESKETKVTGSDIKPLSPFTVNLSKKLFENSKFSLRNPRKISIGKSQPTGEIKTNNVVNKENREKDLTNDQPEPGSTHFFNSNVSFTLKNESVTNKNVAPLCVSGCLENLKSAVVLRQLNKGWLQRATPSITLELEDDACEKPSKCTEKFGLTNVKVPNLSINASDYVENVQAPHLADKASDYVENSESEAEDTINKLKPALKKRKLNDHSSTTIMEKHKNYSEKPTVEIKKSKKGKCQSNPKKKQQRKNTAITIDKSIVRKDQPPDITEYLPFGLEGNVTPRHSIPADILKTANSSVKCVINSTDKGKIDKLEKKIVSGTLNDNFVKINIEKKVFVRGKKNIKYSKFKKQQWKDKKALNAGIEFPESGKLLCFKCGTAGHMARYCTAHRGDTLLPLESYDESETPTLEDMQNIVTIEANRTIPEQLTATVYEPSPIPDSFLKLLAGIPGNESSADVKPIYSDHMQETPAELHTALKKFGHDSFRPGQEEAIMRILSGMSTLLILSTGGGKSLCYQLPAYIYSQYCKCITLVISPLVSLMEDQVLSMPEFLKAGCLHTNQPPTQRNKIIQCLKDGEINILLISPEALISDGANGFAGLFKSLPQIAFACIDEAHCVSQWSHNFRPSYLMICRVLQEKLNVKCILGLTATASQTTIKSIISHINIPDGLTGVITNPTLPDNLCLSVSFEKDKDRALIAFLTSERINSYNSIIVYCIRRDECERVAAILRSCLQEPGKVNMEQKNNKRKRMSYISEAYHAGMSAAQRRKIQKHFMDGTLRIIVATVAFGMGINKSDIRCIIHYNMPSSFESYVQEVGRAGRDGKPAHCHVFMNNNNNDKNELLKHVHANTVDRPTIRKLLQKVFIPCQCRGPKDVASISKLSNSSRKERCKGHEVGIPIDSTVEELDLPSENIATLLCYVELHHKQYIKVLNSAYTICKISSYGGPQVILEAAKNCPPLAMAYLLESKRDPEVTKKSILEFQVIEVAAAVGWESGMTKYHLKNLEWITDGGSSRRSQLKIEFNTLGFRIKSPGDLSPTELDAILDDMHNSVLTQEKAMLYQLEESNRAFSKLANYSLEKSNLSEEFLVEKSNELKHTIRNYFQRENNVPTDVELEERPLDVECVTSDVRALISSYKDCNFTGRSIARIFQGISSPNYPAILWGRCKFWRSHIHEDFYGLMKVATQQIIQMKM